MKKIAFYGISALLFLSSCSKDSTPAWQPGDKGELEVEFDNVVGSSDLILNTGSYTNAAGESFKITKFDYYISNVVLYNEDGSTYTLPKDSSYFLVKESVASSTLLTLHDIPAGNYKGISFIVGVDSLKCTAPLAERTGVLDPAGAGAGMYWTWNSGYIFLKMEGTSSASTDPTGVFMYHIGGFGGYSSPTINNIKKITLMASGSSRAEVRKNKPSAPHIHIMADAARVMNGSTNVSIAANSAVMFAPYSVNIANNYANMFSIDHIHND
jgi:hypothetical protein